MQVVQRQSCERLRALSQKLIELRRQTFKAKEWPKYEYIVKQSSFLDIRIKEEVLSYVLHKLEIPFSLYKESLDYIMKHKGEKTARDFYEISKV